jgi:hypothetical protein
VEFPDRSEKRISVAERTDRRAADPCSWRPGLLGTRSTCPRPLPTLSRRIPKSPSQTTPSHDHIPFGPNHTQPLLTQHTPIGKNRKHSHSLVVSVRSFPSEFECWRRRRLCFARCGWSAGGTGSSGPSLRGAAATAGCTLQECRAATSSGRLAAAAPIAVTAMSHSSNISSVLYVLGCWMPGCFFFSSRLKPAAGCLDVNGSAASHGEGELNN